MDPAQLDLCGRKFRLQQLAQRIHACFGPLMFDIDKLGRKTLLLHCIGQLLIHGVEFDIRSRSIQSHLFPRVFQSCFRRLNAQVRGIDVALLRNAVHQRLHRRSPDDGG